MRTGNQLRQIAPFLRLGTPAPDLVDAEIGMGAVTETDRGRGALDLLHRDDMLQISEAKAAILLLDRDAVETERAHLRP
jgi:hypothetical protein